MVDKWGKGVEWGRIFLGNFVELGRALRGRGCRMGGMLRWRVRSEDA